MAYLSDEQIAAIFDLLELARQWRNIDLQIARELEIRDGEYSDALEMLHIRQHEVRSQIVELVLSL